MARNVKEKVIQIQKPAQSLEAFRAKAAMGESDEGLLKPIAIGGGVVILAAALFFGYRGWRSNQVEKFETTLAEIEIAVAGTPGKTPTPAELEGRMRAELPKLEALAQSAPSDRKAIAQGLVASWKYQLDGKGAEAPVPGDPWSRLRLARRQVALAQGKEALATLEPLRKDAGPDTSWGHLYWMTLLEADRVNGNRDQAWKDLGEYKQRFKELAEAEGMERIISGI